MRGISEESGFELHPRLTIHPEYVVRGEPWLDPRLSSHVAALAVVFGSLAGRARSGVRGVGRPWQEPDGGLARLGPGTGRTDLHAGVDTGRTAGRRADFDPRTG